MRSIRTGVVVVLVGVLSPLLAPRAAAADEHTAVVYRPPVDAPVVDVFRPPATPYGAGNRGIDYGTTPGQAVTAAAEGEVVFAGQVGTSRHVVVLHADGIRTSYSFLATTTVKRGQTVDAGDRIGTTADDHPLHFGARAPGEENYLDPLVLLGQAPQDDGENNHSHHPAHLVDDPDAARPLSESVERRNLIDGLRGLIGRGGSWLRDHTAQEIGDKVELARALADTARDLGVPMPVQLAAAALEWQAQQHADRCTPPLSTPPPDHPASNSRPPRIVILVGGLGSATGHTAVLDVDTTALGYDAADVHQFSYAATQQQAYTPADTLGDITEQGAHLAALIDDLQRTNPGSPVDVIAHSQGGLVARSAITTSRARPTTVVTLGTPHQGTDLATAATAVNGSATGHAALDAIGTAATTVGLTGIDPSATSIRQMGESSDFIRNLPEEGWPDSTFVTSVAARGDPVVPNRHSHLQEPPAHNVVVSANGTQGLGDHVHLPGSPEATAEIARAIIRQPPTCRTLRDALVDAATSWRQSTGEDLLGAALAVGALTGDARLRLPTGFGEIGGAEPPADLSKTPSGP